MRKRIIDMLLGFLIGSILTVIGAELYLRFFTNYDLFVNFDLIRKAGLLGRIVAIGSLLNLGIFTFFINRREDYKARGCIFAVIIITLITQLL
ncbi:MULTISPECIES: hypothetical protein [unclassified Myroides]|uniref:hypothetical protein n=1 Tax=unclassified Myroides TaxID=2642485 RepID=UPI0015F91DF4|nr:MULTISPECIES: hypothetical protein [unclassified Myroides]MBB1148611.1 hypothetical protein [Myroides sp. NP-2]MDM1406322.1 hypothetical protein [Myroides sp. DF42-4-2]